MKALELIYKVELTREETETIIEALDSLFEINKVAYEDAENEGRKEDAKHYYSECSRFCTLRNSFANLVGWEEVGKGV